MTKQATDHLSRIQKMIDSATTQNSQTHEQFLKMRASSLQQIGDMIEMQLGNSLSHSGNTSQSNPPSQPALFNREQLVEFATGSVAKCFGPEFNIFEGRRSPRIPNGDLMLMDRVVQIEGQRHQFKQVSSIVVDYDVPNDAWFYQDNAYPYVPYSVWMEIALQPCGFLSAYLGTSLIYPEMDFYFRNLDGSSQLLNNMDVRGKTLTTRARLLSTTASDNTIIQKFDFEITCENINVFQGQSVFGFFPPEVMAKQAGLDGVRKNPPQTESLAPAGQWLDCSISHPLFSSSAEQPHYHLSNRQLKFLDRVFIPQDQNKYPIFAIRENNPQAWFYTCHFYQDPVMPGSLGVEAIIQSMQVYALQKGLGKPFSSPHFELVCDQLFQWKYRGQILKDQRQMKIETTITGIKETRDQIIITADASLWADQVRIYEVKGAAISIRDGHVK